jgi:AmmeMemoRadiSam system protein A
VTGRLTASDREVIKQIVDLTLLDSIEFDVHSDHWRELDLSWVPPRLQWHGTSFVTLERDFQLLGCIGALQAYQPLAEDIVEHTLAAAYRDPRFRPVTPEDIHALDFEVSVLTPLAQVPVDNLADLIAILRPGFDGLFVESPGHRGTLLPSVSEEFIAGTWRKAGLQPGEWPHDLDVYTYEVEKIDGRGPR